MGQTEQVAQLREVSEPFAAEPPPGFGKQVVVLPVRIDGDVGIYDNALVHLVKELRAEGLDADFFNASSERRWQELRGDVPIEIVIAAELSPVIIEVIRLVLGRILDRGESRDIEFMWLRERGHADGSVERDRVEIRGPRDDVLDTLARYTTGSGERGRDAATGREGDEA